MLVLVSSLYCIIHAILHALVQNSHCIFVTDHPNTLNFISTSFFPCLSSCHKLLALLKGTLLCIVTVCKIIKERSLHSKTHTAVCITLFVTSFKLLGRHITVRKHSWWLWLKSILRCIKAQFV